MTSPALDRRAAPAALTPPRKDAAPAPRLPALPTEPNEAAGAMEPDEVLIADTRGALTPSRVVEQRVAALLRLGPPRPLGEAGRARDAGRAPGATEGGGPSLAERGARRAGAESGGRQMSAAVPKLERTGNVSVLTFTAARPGGRGGRLAAELEGRAEEALAGHLLLDFGNVDFISSEELGALVTLHRAVKASGGQLTLFNLTAQVYEVFTATRLHKLLAICRERLARPGDE
jgi:anti-anti-sigma factor